MKELDKINELRIELVESERVSVPGLKTAIANIELKKTAAIPTGDHTILVGEVLRFSVNTSSNELPLLSVGPFTDGYKVLRKKGIHRLATVVQGIIEPS